MATRTKTAIPPPVDPKGAAVRVAAKVPGFRRAGRAWSKEATTVAVDELTPEQVQALLAEPLLTVAYVYEAEEAEGQ